MSDFIRAVSTSTDTGDRILTVWIERAICSKCGDDKLCLMTPTDTIYGICNSCINKEFIIVMSELQRFPEDEKEEAKTTDFSKDSVDALFGDKKEVTMCISCANILEKEFGYIFMLKGRFPVKGICCLGSLSSWHGSAFIFTGRE